MTDRPPLTELRIAEIFAKALGVASVDPDDDFFDLGGNSFLALEVVEEFAREGVNAFPLAEFFVNATSRHLAGIAASLRETRGS